MGGKARSAQRGLDLARPRGKTTPRTRFGYRGGASTTFPFAEFPPKHSTGRGTPRTDAAEGFLYCSPDAASPFPRRTDRGRRSCLWRDKHFRARRDGCGRRDLCGWRPTSCKTAHPYGFPRSAAGSGGRRVRQGRRAERQGRLSGPTVPKGGASLRASLAAVGSGQAAPLPALGVRSSHAGGSGSILAAFIF